VGRKAKAPDLKFRKAKAADKPYKLADRDGLYLFVTPSEAKSWRFDAGATPFVATSRG
jgi:hypothetical protein